MYRLLFSLAILTTTFTIAFAQPTKFDKGDLNVKAGIGLIPTFAADNGKVTIPPLSLELGYRLSRNFSLSAYGAYSVTESERIEVPGEAATHFENQFLILGLKGAGHANPADNLDVYGGFLIGYNMPFVDGGDPADSEVEGPRFSRPSENKLTYSGFVGASYFLSPKTGLFAEIGYGISLVNIGVNVKL